MLFDQRWKFQYFDDCCFVIVTSLWAFLIYDPKLSHFSPSPPPLFFLQGWLLLLLFQRLFATLSNMTLIQQIFIYDRPCSRFITE